MALSEAEELELLSLERERAMASQAHPEPTLSNIAKLVPQMGLIASNDARKNSVIPAAITAAGLSGGGVAAGLTAGLATIGKRMVGIATGKQPPAGTPFQEAKGPMLDAALTGITQEPKVLNEIPGVPAVKEMAGNLASKTGRGIAKAAQAFSGGKAGDFIEAAKKGYSTYAAPTMEKAKTIFQKALDKLPGESVAPTMAEHVASALTPESSAGNKYLLDLAGRLDKGELIDARQALKAKQSLDDVIDVVPIWQTKRRAKLFDLKSTFDDILSSQSGQMKEASNTYRAAVLKDNLTKWLPVNKHGDYSRLAPMLSTMAGAATGIQSKNAEKGALGMGGTLLATSPLMMGALATTGGAGVRGLMKLGENPAIRQALLQVLRQLTERKSTLAAQD